MRVDKPWGWYEDLFRTPEFVLKRIHIAPGGTLSLQKHAKRDEVWYVESGQLTTQMTLESFHSHLVDGVPTTSYTAKQVFIEVKNVGGVVGVPVGTVHRMSNDTATPVTVIELQIGKPICEENDIKRLADIYGRA